MPFITIANVIMVEVRQTWNEQRVENTLYFHKTSSIAPGDPQAVADAVRDYWTTNMLPYMSTKVSLREVYARDMTAAFGFEATSTPIPAPTGANDSPSLPNNCSIVISFRSGITGRGSRGRNYWVGLTENQVTDNEVLPAPLGVFTAAYAGMIGPAAVLPGFQWVVVSRYLNKNPRSGGGQALNVEQVTVTDATVDSQRRRLPGRGR